AVVVVETQRDPVEVRLGDDTRLAKVIAAEVVRDLVRASRARELVILYRRGCEHRLLPVRARADGVRIREVGRRSEIRGQLIGEDRVVVRVDEIDPMLHGLRTGVRVEAEVRRGLKTPTLGGYDDDPVRAARAADGRARGV